MNNISSSHELRIPSPDQCGTRINGFNAPFEPITVGELCVKIAETREEVSTSQQLRYEVFCGEIGATPTEEMKRTGRDFDEFDEYCDHLLVLHTLPDGGQEIVGTYRLLRSSRAKKLGKFYTESEYDITPLKEAVNGEILELGRSCVKEQYRTRPAMQLLWRGIGAYVMHYGIELMFGCASFAGDNPQEHAAGLSYLHHYHLAPEQQRPKALPDLYTSCDLLPKDMINEKRAFHSLPVLLKGYLRLGGVIGDGAVLDHDYNTTDVCIVVKTDLVGEKYRTKFAPE
jgi:putative hemolysin